MAGELLIRKTDESATNSSEYIVELDKVCKSFIDDRTSERVITLDHLDMTVDRAEMGAFLVLVGPSGCGKSTILNLISGLSLADEGAVRVNGVEVNGPSPASVTVPQAYTCFPWLSIQQNVEFGLSLDRRYSKRVRQERAREYLRKVGLEDRCDAYPRQLSGGMQQRVAIARTLAMQPQIVLMDEPFGALDAQTRSDMQQMLLQLWDAEKNTIIFVTHDIAEALLLADRVIVFSRRPARVVWEKRNLDNHFGHYRPPELMRDSKFIDMCDEVRRELHVQSDVHAEPAVPSHKKKSRWWPFSGSRNKNKGKPEEPALAKVVTISTGTGDDRQLEKVVPDRATDEAQPPKEAN